jgi:cystathionine beta-lyase
LVINFFTRKGDKVVIQPPVYHPFRLLTEGNERVVVENPLIADADGNYTMDLPGLEKAFATEHPKLMILCNPHNPIGLQWSRETLTEVGRLARKYGVTVISDEIHGDLMLKHRQHVPFADCGDDCAAVGITFGAPSKTFNIPGLVSSWCVIKNEELRKPFFNWLTVNELNSPTFVATIGTEAAYNHGEPWLDELLTYLQGNLDAMDAFIKAQMPQVSMVMPQASFLAWVDFSRLHLTHDELINLVEQRAGLAFNDGEMFGVAQGRGFMRVNVAMPRALLLEALQKLADAVNSL